MILCIVPTILGKGIPLFPDGTPESRWRPVKTTHFPTGIVGITYEPTMTDAPHGGATDGSAEASITAGGA